MLEVDDQPGLRCKDIRAENDTFGLPALLVLPFARMLPESPRWLANHGRAEEAERLAKDLIEHQTTFAGRSIQQVYHVDFSNQHGDLVAAADSWCFRTDRDLAREEGTKYTALKAKPQKRYTDEELAGIHAALVGSIAPPEMLMTLRWMVPFMAPAERAAADGATVIVASSSAERIDAADNFFELGGHSLLGTMVLARIREQFGTELSIRAIFEAPTPRALGERIRENRPAESGIEVAVSGEREEFEI